MDTSSRNWKWTANIVNPSWIQVYVVCLFLFQIQNVVSSFLTRLFIESRAQTGVKPKPCIQLCWSKWLRRPMHSSHSFVEWYEFKMYQIFFYRFCRFFYTDLKSLIELPIRKEVFLGQYMPEKKSFLLRLWFKAKASLNWLRCELHNRSL